MTPYTFAMEPDAQHIADAQHIEPTQPDHDQLNPQSEAHEAREDAIQKSIYDGSFGSVIFDGYVYAAEAERGLENEDEGADIGENEECIRAKWAMDGATTLSQAAD
jgi:hypothetical protein